MRNPKFGFKITAVPLTYRGGSTGSRYHLVYGVFSDQERCSNAIVSNKFICNSRMIFRMDRPIFDRNVNKAISRYAHIAIHTWVKTAFLLVP